MNKDVNNGQSRREFLGRSVAALAAASFLPSAFSCTGKSVAAPAPVDTAAEAGKVNSKFGGVQIGTITYSWRSMPGGLENIIKYCQEANISSIELMGGDLEAYLGAPENPMMKFFRQQPQHSNSVVQLRKFLVEVLLLVGWVPRSLLRSSRLRSINIRKR